MEVLNLGEQGERRQRVDPPETAEAGGEGLPRWLLGERLELTVEGPQPVDAEVELGQVLVTGPLGGGVVEVLGAQPRPVAQGPRTALPPDPAMAEQELAEPVPLASDVLAEILAARSRSRTASSVSVGMWIGVSSPAR